MKSNALFFHACEVVSAIRMRAHIIRRLFEKRFEMDQHDIESALKHCGPRACLKDILRECLNGVDVCVSHLPHHIKFQEVCNILELRGFHHSQGFYHYTTWENFVKMVLGNGNVPAYRLFLGSCEKMNDVDDRNCGKGTFFTSFSCGFDENLAMWQIYSQRKGESDGIRIRFSQSAILKWFAERAYERNAKGMLGDRIENVSPIDVHFSDVAYYQELAEGTQRVVYYRRHRAKVDDFDTNFGKSKKRILFKRSGWRYENEVRMSAYIEDAAFDKLIVDFKRPLKHALENVSKNIVLGPWFDKTRAQETLDKLMGKAQGFDLNDVALLECIIQNADIKSAYTNHAKSICNDCVLKKREVVK